MVCFDYNEEIFLGNLNKLLYLTDFFYSTQSPFKLMHLMYHS
jgi:hypothetical protein